MATVRDMTRSAATSPPNSTGPRSGGGGTGEGRGDRLDWQAFSARYFPDRRRHDFEVLTAYHAYKMPRRDNERLSSPQVNTPARSAENRARSQQADIDKARSTALRVWEEEGGAVCLVKAATGGAPAKT